MNSFKIGKFVVIGVHTNAEEEAGISPVDNLVVPELVSRLVSMSKCGQRDIPRQNLIDISDLVGQLSDVLPRVAGPAVEG